MEQLSLIVASSASSLMAMGHLLGCYIKVVKIMPSEGEHEGRYPT